MARSTLKTYRPLLVLVVLVLSSYVLVNKFSSNFFSQPHPPVSQDNDRAELGQFVYTNADGSMINLSELVGKVWVADLIFTNCQGPCNFMSAKMRALQKEYAQNQNVKFVSITVDPDNDSPKVMLEYAKRYDAPMGQWFFLTGPQDQTIKLARKLFKVPADKEPDLHSTHFVLLDANGKVHGTFNSQELNFAHRIKASIDGLLVKNSLQL